jgi:hypothetical protein
VSLAPSPQQIARRDRRSGRAGDRVAVAWRRVTSSLSMNRPRHGELVSDRVLRFPDRTWAELERLPRPLRDAAHSAIFRVLDEPVPALADPFPEVDRFLARTASICRPTWLPVGAPR